MSIADVTELRRVVRSVVRGVPITDIHTHLYPPGFGRCDPGLLLWGIDELLTYHYLVAETFRCADIPYDRFWTLSKQAQADLIWKTLFLDASPISEACRGVLTVLGKLGLDLGSRDLASYRRFFAGKTVSGYVDEVLASSGVETVVMTNDPFNDEERGLWLEGPQRPGLPHRARRRRAPGPPLGEERGAGRFLG